MIGSVYSLAVDELARRGEFTPPDQCLEGSRFTPELVAQALNKGGIPKFRDFKKDVSRVFQSNVKPKLIRGKDGSPVVPPLLFSFCCSFPFAHSQYQHGVICVICGADKQTP